MIPFELSDKKKALLGQSGHILVLGGPGSGKTTIALFKARKIIEDGVKKGQRILFLSFARSTVTRVSEQAKNIVTKEIYRALEINTYHGFSWNLLRAHGYLLNNKKAFSLLPPPEAAARLADIERDSRKQEMARLFAEEGLVHFDLFSGLVADLLEKSQSLTRVLCNGYPIIILDEFQDTDSNEWRFIQQLGKYSTIIALADLDQRIYEFRGADPARVGQFIKLFKPSEYDFGTENNRSNGTDIAQFGNDVLTGKNKGKTYTDVAIKYYPRATGNGTYVILKTELLESIKRLNRAKIEGWSVAVLLPSNKLMLKASDFLAEKQQFINRTLPAITHDVAMDMAGPSLAAVLISRLMEQGDSDSEVQFALIHNLCDHLRGKAGANPSQASLELAKALRGFAATGIIRGSVRSLIVNEALAIAEKIRKVKFTGDPVADWILTRDLLERSQSEAIAHVAQDARFLRLLRKGAVLASGLGTLWRNRGSYVGAGAVVRTALAEEHFATAASTWKGVHVMTLHKAKGKEFDEVIIYEGEFAGRFLRSQPPPTKKETDQSKLALRVAVTRARRHTTIITPSNDPCPLL